MKTQNKFFLFFFILLLVTNFVRSQTKDEAAIKDEINKWMRAYNHKELDNSVAILSDNYVGFYAGHEDQTPKTIKEQNDEVFKNKYLKATLSMEADEIVTSGDLAYVAIKQKWAFKPTVSTKPQIAYEKGILIFQKQKDGKWRMTRSSTFPVNAPK